VQIAGTVVNVKGHAANGGCSNLEVIQVTIPPAGEQFEAAWYSEIGLGTRWWQSPGEPSPIVNGAASYTTPPGQAAWSGAGGNGGPGVCNEGIPAKTFGVKAWALTSGKGSGGGGGGRGSGRLSVRGPTHNAFHVLFNQVVTGSASGAANYVVSGEQLGWTPRCASTLASEESRPSWQRWPTGTGPVHAHFRLVARSHRATISATRSAPTWSTG
jgi:hypothetical protein